MKCDYCRKNSIYRCSTCARVTCAKHTRLRPVCPSCAKKNTIGFGIAKAVSERETAKIRELVKVFWGEEEQLTFDKKFVAAKLPAYVARVDKDIAGFVSFADVDDAIVIVALGILPEYQNAGVGRSLIERVEAKAKRLRKKRLLVSTSNDDLPALAFYQSIGFQIYEVKPDAIAEKHGEIFEGVGGLPIRDELRLRKTLH